MKRKWFQIHLSTAIVLSMVAGSLLGLNLWRRDVPPDDLISDAIVSGWPFPTVTYAEWSDEEIPQFSFSRQPFTYTELRFKHPLENPQWHYNGIILNALIGLGMLAITASVYEHLARRREPREK
jgi:hypothetical protein